MFKATGLVVAAAARVRRRRGEGGREGERRKKQNVWQPTFWRTAEEASQHGIHGCWGDIGRGKECHAGCMVVVVKTIHTYIICVRYLLHMLGEEREGREA